MLGLQSDSSPYNHESYVLRKYHGEICDVLNVSKDSLLSFTQKLFAMNIIDRDTKISVTRTGGKEGVGILLDHIEMKVEQNPDYLLVVLELMENDEYLCHIVKNIKGEYEGEEIVISLILDTLQSLIICYCEKENRPLNVWSNTYIYTLYRKTTTFGILPVKITTV